MGVPHLKKNKNKKLKVLKMETNLALSTLFSDFLIFLGLEKYKVGIWITNIWMMETSE